MTPIIDGDRMQHLCSAGSVAEVRAAVEFLVQTKLDIQAQLSVSKSDMSAVRAELLSQGEEPRHAQVRASASTDQDWRGRAVRAQIAIDAKIRRLNARLTALNVSAHLKPAKGVAERRAVQVPARSIADLTEFVQSWLDDGWSVVQSITHPDGHVLVMRNDSPKGVA